MRVEVLGSAAEVAALRDDWDGLDAAFDAPVVRNDWVVASLERLADGGHPEVVCVFDGTDLVAAAPLVRHRSWLGFPGQREHGEPAGVVYRDREALARLLDAIVDLRRPTRLIDLQHDSPVVAGLSGRSGITTIVRASGSCPTLELPPDATSTDDVLSSSLRSDLRRAQRRAAEVGEAVFRMHSPVSADDLDPLLDESMRVEAAGWKGRSGTALRHHEALGAFFASYASRAAEHKHLRIGLLEVAGEPAAALIAAEWADRLWLLKIGYDERFAAMSPGSLLLAGAVGHAVDRGLAAVEFLGASAPWTRRWTRLERRLVGVRIYPHTAGGAARLAGDTVRAAARRLVRSIGQA